MNWLGGAIRAGLWKRALALFSGAFLFFAAWSPVWAGFPGQEKIISPGLLAKVLEGGQPVKVLVLLKGHQALTGIDFREDKSLLAAHQAAVARAVQAARVKLDSRKCRPLFSLDNLPAFGAEVDLAGLKELAALDDVALIEADKSLRPTTAQGVPLMNPGTYRDSYGGRGVGLAIIDGGIDYSHPALGGGDFPNGQVIGGYDFGEGDPDPMDDSQSAPTAGHGTACAGIAAGLNTGWGSYIGGVAPQAKLYALKVSDAENHFPCSAIIRALDWCLSHGRDNPAYPIKIISISLSVAGYAYSGNCDGIEPLVFAAIRNAVANGMAVFVGAGNDGFCDGLNWPACYSNTISVGAVYDARLAPRKSCISSQSCTGTYHATCPGTTKACFDSAPERDRVACYSNSASTLDLLAPANYASVPQPRYGYTATFGGTSAACPYAAGAAAVVQSWAKARLGRYLTVAELKRRLVENGDSVRDSKSGRTTPRINISRTINLGGSQTGVNGSPD